MSSIEQEQDTLGRHFEQVDLEQQGRNVIATANTRRDRWR